MIICGRPWPLNNEKPFAFIVCGKCMVETFDFTSMSSSGLISLRISFFIINVIKLGGKNKQKYDNMRYLC
jgi:hypothetical protein